MNRFQDQNIRLTAFEDEIFVECPKCTLRATVTKEDPASYFSQRMLKCPNCFYAQIGKKESFRIELNCHCSHCAAELKVILKNVNEKKNKIAVRCANCGKVEDYEPRNILQQWKYKKSDKPVDQYFGLPLWLTDDFRGNSFWAFNYEHLAYLKQYILADLRERNGRSHWTMVEKLPDWIKSSKNRDNLAKLITELEKR